MTQTLQNKLSNSKKARWTALLLVSVTMMLGYFFTDVMSPLEPLLTEARGLTEAQGGTGFGLGWTSDEYGFFSGAYGYFNVFLLLLFLGGVILDKFGIRFTGIMSTILMFLGAILKWYAVSHNFEGTINVPFFGEYQTQVVLAATGFAIYGVGCEIAGVTVTKILVKWFTGHELALAMGLQVALARIGTACTLAYSLPFAMGKHIEYVDTHSVGDFFANINAGIINGLTSLKDFLGLSSGVQASVALGAAMLCIGMIAYLVYCVMDKKEDASAAAIQAENEEGFKFSDLKILFCNRGFWYIAVLCLMFYAVLGIAFGLVPSAMWPSVPKIIPMEYLGTAYALIFYIQNIGLALVPVWIGKVNQANTMTNGKTIDYTESMTIFAIFGVVAIIISLLLIFEDKRKKYGLEKPNIERN